MTRKSKLCGFIIDCRADDLAAAADLWSRALGMRIRALPVEEGEKYVRLVDRNSGLHMSSPSFELQANEWP